MGISGEKPPRATYADLLAVPSQKVAEIIHGVLRAMPRPAPRHAQTSSALGVYVGGPFGFGVGGPGGWRILDEPELHFGAEELEDILVPDLAGWRIEGLPELPSEAYFTLALDWVGEVLSPSTAADDRADEVPIYAREGVAHLWLIDPLARTLEVFNLGEDGHWIVLGVHRDAARVRPAPFGAIELALAALWG